MANLGERRKAEQTGPQLFYFGSAKGCTPLSRRRHPSIRQYSAYRSNLRKSKIRVVGSAELESCVREEMSQLVPISWHSRIIFMAFSRGHHDSRGFRLFRYPSRDDVTQRHPSPPLNRSLHMESHGPPPNHSYDRPRLGLIGNIC